MAGAATRRTVVHRDASCSRHETNPRWTVLVVTRYRVGSPEDSALLERMTTALDALASQGGFRSGRIGRAADDPAYWVMATEWDHVGAYRRALSAYEVRVHAVPLLSLAIDEPSAYEVLVSTGIGADTAGGTRRSDRAADAGVVGLGHASGPDVPTDLPG